jgi:uncharacterized protein
VGDVRKLWIEGAAGRIECLMRAHEAPRATAVLAHPHPLHGGTMQNPVMFHADRELNRAGFFTLRVNFRGVGASDGVHDAGRGETDDLELAARWMRGLVAAPLFLIGYSFGSWCAVRAARREAGVGAVVAIGLPVNAYDFPPELAALAQPLAAVHGSEDELAAVDDVRRVLGEGRQLYRIEGASHLFPGRAPEAGARVAEAAEVLLAQLQRSAS